MTPRPIVDLAPKPSRLSRVRAWLRGPVQPPEAYRARPCDSELMRVIHYGVIAIIAALVIIAWVFFA